MDILTSLLTNINKVADNVYIGNKCAGNDPILLKKYNITKMIKCDTSEIPVLIDGISTKVIPIGDNPNSEIKEYFDDCIKMINNAILNKQTILVHCDAGSSRSASIIIAWIMHDKKIDFISAYKILKHIRPCIEPNEGFVSQLKSLKF